MWWRGEWWRRRVRTRWPAPGPAHPLWPDGLPEGMRPRLLGTDFVDEVKRGFGGAPEPGEAGVGDDLPDGGLAGLRAERVAAGLGQRVRHAQQRGGAVVDPPDRVHVARHVVGGGGLDDEPRAVGLERLTDVPGRGQWVAHVVQA